MQRILPRWGASDLYAALTLLARGVRNAWLDPAETRPRGLTTSTARWTRP